MGQLITSSDIPNEKNVMKPKSITSLAIAVTALALHLRAATSGFEKTIIGDGACAKCILKERGVKECQLTVTTDLNGKKITYYIVNNDVTRKFGKPVCQKRSRIAVTGELTAVDGVRELTPTRIVLLKETEVPKIPESR